MAYITPSVLVYQQLANAGGVANTSPDLPGVIVGPCYNVVKFDTTSASALSLSKAAEFDYVEGSPTATAAPATLDITLPSVKAGQSVSTADLANLEVWFYDALVQSYTEAAIPASAIAVDVVTVSVDPLGLTAGGDVKVEAGDRIHFAGSVGSEELTSTVKSATATSITVNDSVALALASTISGTGTFTVTVHKSYTSIQATGGISTATTQADDVITLTMPLSSTHGTIDGAEAHVDYRALRTDLGGTILDITDIEDAQAKLEDLSDDNPLGLGVQLALANTVDGIKAVSIDSNDLAGYQAALDLLEGSDDVYGLAPLTQDSSIHALFATHAAQMSTPTEAAWRIALVNTSIPTTQEVGTAGGHTGATLILDGSHILELGSASFLGEGYRAGDVVTLVDNIGSESGDYVIDEVLNNNRISFLNGPSTTSTDVDFTVNRTLTKSDQSTFVESVSEGFNSNRVAHIMPDLVGVQVNGATKMLPGYYLCAGLAGAIAGFPVQQGFTNISLAGYTDLDHSNFYFSRNQLNSQAEKGTMIFAQLVQDGTPYCRHELMTDMSTLQYRELLKVKNLDYLSYYFRDLLKPFIGSWNITDDTLNTMRQVIIAASEQLLGRRLPKIGAPLVSYNLKELKQDENNKDQVIIELEVATADPNNYTNLYLIV